MVNHVKYFHFNSINGSHNLGDIKASLGSNDRFCKLGNDSYGFCSNYCCGEFWESSWSFCCTNNFKAIRNLFIFLLISFLTQFITIIIYLSIEVFVRSIVKSRLKQLAALCDNAPLSDLQSLNREQISSDDTTLDDESSMDERTTIQKNSNNRGSKKFLYKHSQSFKDMSKMNSMRRNKAKSLKSRPFLIVSPKEEGISEPVVLT